MRRIVMLLAVAAVMAVMLVVSASLALAHTVTENGGCRSGFTSALTSTHPDGASKDRNGDGIICFKGSPKGTKYSDNHAHTN